MYGKNHYNKQINKILKKENVIMDIFLGGRTYISTNSKGM